MMLEINLVILTSLIHVKMKSVTKDTKNNESNDKKLKLLLVY